jgi:hypothetical protein
MGSDTIMNNLNTNSISDFFILAVPNLHDDGSNWADHQPRLQDAMGVRGLWRHVEGTASAPVPYAVSNGILMLADGKTPATKEKIKAKESKMIKFEKREYLACHILMSTTLMHLGTKIKSLATPEDMWKAIKEDAMSKSTLIDAEDQLFSIKLIDNDNPKIYLSELEQHFQLMLQHCDNLIKIRSVMSDSQFNTIIMSPLPESY